MGSTPATSTTWARDSSLYQSLSFFGYFTNLWAWTYFIFIVSLFTWRQIDDEKQCAEKYGKEKWAEYQIPRQIPHNPRHLLNRLPAETITGLPR